MIAYDYQVDLANTVYGVLKENMIAYLAAEERTGKTLSCILAAEKCDVKKVLVITKKKAVDGWLDTLAKYDGKTKLWRVINYHSAHKVNTKPDLVILDECHNYLSAFPKIGTTQTKRNELKKAGKANTNIYDAVKRICHGVPIIYSSATPHAQGLSMLYHQLSVSSWSPWRHYATFYTWYSVYGKPRFVKVAGVDRTMYNGTLEEKVLADVSHLFITKTRQELGFEHEPEDKLHFIELGEDTRYVYNQLLEHNIYELSVGWLVCDTDSKLRTSLHQLEGGTIKIDDQYHILANDEKIQHILKHFGDTEDLVIMYNYQAEQKKLERVFKKAKVLQATSFAEGVDLSMHKHLVIYSQDFSTARHTQRRARQANKQRKEPIVVHYLLVKKGLSQQVYKTVSVNKKNFVDSVFKKDKI